MNPLVKAQVLTDSTLVPTAYWKVGETYTYKVSEKVKFISKKNTESKKSSYKAYIEVLKETDSSYQLRWSTDEFSIHEDLDFLARIQLLLYRECEFTIQTSEFGRFENLLNWEDVRDVIQNRITEMSADELRISEKKVEKAKKDLSAQYQSKEQITVFANKRIREFFYLHGSVLFFQEENKYDKIYVNPYFKFEMTGTEQYFISSLSTDSSFAEIDIKAGLGEKEATVLVVDYVNKNLNLLGLKKEMEKEDVPPVSWQESYRYGVDLETGVIESFNHKKRVRLDTEKKDLSIRYTLILKE